MRLEFSMAGDGPTEAAISSAHWFAPLLGFASAAVGALAVWLAQRLLGKAAFQTAINQGFASLSDSLQRDRARLAAEVEDLRIKCEARDAQQRGEIINLTQTIESLKRILRAAGISVPENRAPPADYLELEARIVDSDPS